jgi:hypothetical protein
MQGKGSRVQGSKVQRFKVQGSGFKGSRFRVQRFKVHLGFRPRPRSYSAAFSIEYEDEHDLKTRFGKI